MPGWEENEFKYVYGKSILSWLLQEHLISKNEMEKCADKLIKLYKPVIGSLDVEIHGKEKSNND